MSVRVSALALVAAMALAGGCSQPRPERRVDEAAMALLGSARALHHEADVFEGAGDFARAQGAMERVLALPFPPSFADATDLRADAWGRLAELDLRMDAADRALARCDEALRATPGESVLQARLHMVRGQSLRALAERAATRGDSASAARLREDAVAALERSIAINDRVLRRLTGAPRR